MEPKTEKMALFIDGANLYATAKSLGFDIDYKRSPERVSVARLSLARLLLHRRDRGVSLGQFTSLSYSGPRHCVWPHLQAAVACRQIQQQLKVAPRHHDARTDQPEVHRGFAEWQLIQIPPRRK